MSASHVSLTSDNQFEINIEKWRAKKIIHRRFRKIEDDLEAFALVTNFHWFYDSYKDEFKRSITDYRSAVPVMDPLGVTERAFSNKDGTIIYLSFSDDWWQSFYEMGKSSRQAILNDLSEPSR